MLNFFKKVFLVSVLEQACPGSYEFTVHVFSQFKQMVDIDQCRRFTQWQKMANATNKQFFFLKPIVSLCYLVFLITALLRYNLQRAKLLPFSFLNTLYFLTPQKKGSLLLGILKWRKSLSGFRNRKAAHWPASNLPGHSPGFVPTCKHNKSGSMLDKKGNESWNSWALGGLANPPESKKSYDSQSETNNIVKVKPELHFCT